MARLFVDNDVALKLVQYDLADDFLETTSGQVVILPTLRYRFHLRDEGKARRIVGSAEGVDRLRRFVQRVSSLSEEPSVELLEVLSAIPAIDEGEAVLFAAGCDDPQATILTGDKRSLIALSEAPTAEKVLAKLRGRVRCLEQVIARLLLQNPISVISKVRSARWDKALYISFNAGGVDAVLERLASYHCDLAARSSGLLEEFPGAT